MSDNFFNIKNLFSDFVKGSKTAAIHQDAFAHFERLGLPKRSSEDWRYTSVKPLLEEWKLGSVVPAANVVDEKSDRIEIHSMSGQFDLAAIKITLARHNIEVLEAPYAEGQQDNAFLQLNNAFLKNGILLKIRKNIKVDKPILFFHRAHGENLFLNPRIAIEMDENSHLSLAEIFCDRSQKNWINSVTTVNQKKNSQLQYYKMYEEGRQVSQVDQNYFKMQEGAQLVALNFAYGSQLSRSNTFVQIEGSHAFCDLRGVSLLNEKNQMDHNIQVHHLAPESQSRQLYKSVLKDESHYVFQGNIKIDKMAQKTDAKQLNRNLLLDKKCRVDTKPQIDVYADDVKATHGATVGQLDPEAQFYLESRCLSADVAKRLLCEGYVLDVIEALPESYLKNLVISRLKKSLKETYV